MSAAKRVILRMAVWAALSRVTAGRLASLTTIALPATTAAPPSPVLHMTRPPHAPVHAAIQARQALEPEVCGISGVDTYHCEDGWCSTVFARETGFVACCQSLDCTVYTTCYEQGGTQTSRGPDDQARTCSGSAPDCLKIKFNSGSVVAFGCTCTTGLAPSSTGNGDAGGPETSAAVPTEQPTQTPGPGDGPNAGMTQDLTRAQRIGIGVGCGVAGAVFVSIASYCLCFSRKRRQRRLENKLTRNGVTVPVVGTGGQQTGQVPAYGEAEKYAPRPDEVPFGTEQFPGRPNLNRGTTF